VSGFIDVGDDCVPTGFSNLGDAIDRSDPDALAVIDLGGGPSPRFYSYREIDARRCDRVDYSRRKVTTSTSR
jgi:hypothetical protein